MAQPPTPIRGADPDSCAVARALLAEGRHAALAVILADWQQTPGPVPHVSRVALGRDERGWPLLYLSAIALHTRALEAHSALSLLVGDVEAAQDALTQPRLTIRGNAEKLGRLEPDHDQLRQLWRNQHKSAQIYMDLPDFCFFRVRVSAALLNAGFGQAHALLPADLGLS